jgi:hypothetical protein
MGLPSHQSQLPATGSFDGYGRGATVRPEEPALSLLGMKLPRKRLQNGMLKGHQGLKRVTGKPMENRKNRAECDF